MDWNLNDLYPNINSKKISEDFLKLEKRSIKFNKSFKNKIKNKSNPKVVHKAIVELEKIYEGLGKLSSYASLNFAANTNNEKISQFYQSTSEKVSQIRKNLIFFFIDWNNIDSKNAKRISDTKILVKYKNLLESERKYKPYILSESEEKF